VHVSRRAVRGPMLLAVAAAAAGAGGMAYAGWAADSTSKPFTVYASRIPRVDRPQVAVRNIPRVRWTPVELAPGVPMHRYVVTRHLGPVRQIACDVPATAVPRCIDATAPAGYLMTYTVAARYGSRWVGPASEPSAPVVRPGVAVPIVVDGVTIVPGPAGAAVLPEAAPSASVDAVPAEQDVEPSVEASPGEVVTEEPVIVPRAPAPAEIDRPADGGEERPDPAEEPVTESGRTGDPPASLEPDQPAVPLGG
jgi:hypothetical protein